LKILEGIGIFERKENYTRGRAAGGLPGVEEDEQSDEKVLHHYRIPDILKF
jgi:hypothetical protein